MLMQTAYFHPNSKVKLSEVEMPELGQEEVLINIKAGGICGSDLHRFRGYNPWGNEIEYPFRAGHEIAGTIVETGNLVSDLHKGQRVAVEPMQLRGCGLCNPCSLGSYQLCQQRNLIKNRSSSCGFSEFDLAVPSQVFPIPDHLPFTIAALADVYACAVHAANKADLNHTDHVVIIGNGSIGLALTHWLAGKVAQVYLLGRRPLKEDILASLANNVLYFDNVLQCQQNLDRHSQNKGANKIFEVVGGQDNITIKQAIQFAGFQAQITILGAFDDQVAIPYRLANRKELTIQWSNGYSNWQGKREFQIALDWLSENQFIAEKLVTHSFPLNEIQTAFDVANNKRQSGAIKVMLTEEGQHQKEDKNR
jgi:threonine dehydrogenase-like Zn-dependent dehydrogenase